MEIEKYLKDLGSRNNGDVYLGVVGPVRVGKSTFIRKFMEVCVLEHIENEDEIVKKASEEMNANVFFTIPRDKMIQEAEKMKMTVCEAFPESNIAKEYFALAKKIIENE